MVYRNTLVREQSRRKYRLLLARVYKYLFKIQSSIISIRYWICNSSIIVYVYYITLCIIEYIEDFSCVSYVFPHISELTWLYKLGCYCFSPRGWVKGSDCPDVHKEVKAITARGKRREANILPLLRVGQIKKRTKNHLFRLPADVVQGRNSLFDDYSDDENHL